MQIHHYFRKGKRPFVSLSLLPDDEAIEVMRNLYVERGDSTLDGRFKEPEKYLGYRRRTEHWLRAEFKDKGGNPSDLYPTYFTLGRSDWLLDNLDGDFLEFSVNVSELPANEVCFTYPDSMTSWGYGIQQPEEIFNPKLHGQVFALSDVDILLESYHESLDRYTTTEHPTQYIEAQVWCSAELKEVLRSGNEPKNVSNNARVHERAAT